LNHFIFSKLYAQKGNYKKAYENYQAYSNEKDSILNLESIKRIADMQIRYETEKKEKEIQLLNKDKKLKELELAKNHEEIKRQRIFIYSVVSVLIVILKSPSSILTSLTPDFDTNLIKF
jgi:hypothetical protein